MVAEERVRIVVVEGYMVVLAGEQIAVVAGELPNVRLAIHGYLVLGLLERELRSQLL